jgi:hypothetical protein
MTRGNQNSPSDPFSSGLFNKLVMKKEIWKDIPGFEGINKVSDKGRVLVLPRIRLGFSYKTGKKTWRHYKAKILKPSARQKYLCVTLTKARKHHTLLVHRAVALAFIPNPEKKLYVNHIDFNTLNNCIENLEWCTAYENIHHTINHNRDNVPKGEDNGHSKFRNNEVTRIRKLYKLKLANTRQIAEVFAVNQSTISRIINYKTYKCCD